MDTYIASKMAELSRRSRGEILLNSHVRIQISSRSDYSRAASFRACSGAATIREHRLFKSNVYSVIYGMNLIKKESTHLSSTSTFRKNGVQKS